ncbi:MAG: hypothetical protein E7472_00235 [Ruminococcaceae bacterium]|nr:hypothetical protein [Oscillospiraceae bacterium]
MNKKAHLAQILVFLVFIALFFSLNLAIPDKDFSQQENRYLQTAPKFSFQSLFSGKFTTAFEDYVTDQFAFRDKWTALKARSELLCGKDENNGVFLCENETLIEPYTAPENSSLDFSLNAINTLSENAGVPVCFALVPSPGGIWGDKLPAGAPNDSQKATIDYAYAATGAATADIYSVLNAHRDEPIYYRTDHHWTTLGAYYGYTALAPALGFEPLPLSNYTPTVVSESFYGTTYSSSGFSWVAPDSITTYVEQGSAEITNYPEGAPKPGALYDESYLAKKDKYSYFYGGNTPLLTIRTGNEDAPALLILRDSYMDSLSPFLFPHYSEIHIIDLRYYKTSIKAYIDANGIDSVLVCYNVKNFAEDGNIFLAAY